MNWKIANAKKKFSEMIRKAKVNPQIIYNREKMVAVVINPDDFDDFENYRMKVSQNSLSTIFDELRTICKDEEYSFKLPKRNNRKVRFP